MHPEQQAKWLIYLDEQITIQEGRIRESEHARNTADSRMQSRYDTQRENYALEVSIGRDILEALQKAHAEIEESPLRYRVESGAFIDATVDGEPTQFLYLDRRIELPDVMVITPQSPIGQAIKDKIAGDKANYAVGSNRFRIEIMSIL